MEMLMQFFIGGLTMGSIYGLVALGFTLIWQALGHLNFCQGHVVMIGGFLGLTALSLFANIATGVPLVLLVFLFVAISMALMSVAAHYLVSRPILIRSRKKDEAFNMILGTLAVGFFLEDAARLLWSSETLYFPPILGQGLVEIAQVPIPVVYVYILIAAALLVMLISFFLKFTKLGSAMRAVAQDKEVAALMGINIQRTLYATFALTYAIGGLAGVMFAPSLCVVFDTGFIYGVKGFAAAILGGLGSIPGAIFGGLVLGVMENVGAGLTSSAYRHAISMVILILVLIFRPTGMLGKATVKKV